MDNNNSNRLRNIGAALGIILIAFVAVKLIAEVKTLRYIGANSGNSISVSGKGDITIVPDIATFTFSVQEEAANVGDAQKKATDKMNAILAYLKTQNVDDKDVKTTSYDIYPRYDYINGTLYTSGKQVLSAYVVSQSVTLKVRDLTKAGTLLSGIGEYGATNVSGLTFSIDDEDTVKRQARDEAIADARDQAEKLAKSLGVHLGNIVSFSESGSGYPTPIYYAKNMSYGMGGDAMAQSAPSLPTGENKITSNVTIVYEVR